MSESEEAPAETPDVPDTFGAADDDDLEGDGAAGESDGGDGFSPVDALMHTEPDDDPDDQPGDSATGHAIVGSKKVAHYLSDGSIGDTGTPALLNFVLAGYHSIQGGDSKSEDSSTDESLQEGRPSDDLPDGQADIADLEEI